MVGTNWGGGAVGDTGGESSGEVKNGTEIK